MNTGGAARRTPVHLQARHRGVAVLLSLIALASIAAWFASGALLRRAQAAHLPLLPEAAAMPVPVRNDLVSADAAARAHPGSADTVGTLGMTYHASLLPSQAQQAYALAERLAPADPRWPYCRGLLLEERGEQDAAAEAFTRATELDPGLALAWFHLADIAFKQARLGPASLAYERARAAPPAPAWRIEGRLPRQGIPLAAYADLGLARIAIERGDAASAIDRLESLVRQQPRFGAATTLLAQLHHPSGVNAAVSAPQTVPAYVPPADPLLDAIVSRSRHPDLLLKHVALAARGGDQAWREFLVRRALEANPTGLDVLLEMAATLAAQGRHAEALDYLRRCEQVAPGDHHALVQQGKTLSELGRLDEAEQVLRRAAHVRDAAAEYNLGVVLDRQDRWDEARAHYERATAIDPFHIRAMNNLGVGLDRRGETTAALALYARALRAVPGDAEVLSNLGTALINQHRFPEALAALEKAITLDPEAPNGHNNFGIALARSGRLHEAAAQFEEALRRDPAHADARRNLDQVLQAVGKQP